MLLSNKPKNYVEQLGADRTHFHPDLWKILWPLWSHSATRSSSGWSGTEVLGLWNTQLTCYQVYATMCCLVPLITWFSKTSSLFNLKKKVILKLALINNLWHKLHFWLLWTVLCNSRNKVRSVGCSEAMKCTFINTHLKKNLNPPRLRCRAVSQQCIMK